MKYLIITFLLLISFSQNVSANLLVSPTRIAFEDKDRVKDLILINVTDRTRSYRIEWQENSADEFGNYQTIPDSEVSFASSDFIRYSPRQVTLKPGERQVIKLMLRRKSNMFLPEYRSHLKMTALPPSKEQKSTDNDEGIAFKIDVLTSYTIPIIVRTQNGNAKVSISDVKVKVNSKNKAFFEIAMEKEGDTSVTGEINILELNSNSGDGKVVGILRGVNIFHENNKRILNVEWQGFTEPKAGKYKIVYKGTSEQSGEELTVATRAIGPQDFMRIE